MAQYLLLDYLHSIITRSELQNISYSRCLSTCVEYAGRPGVFLQSGTLITISRRQESTDNTAVVKRYPLLYSVCVQDGFRDVLPTLAPNEKC